jgi:CO/xanthine dehydrogenase Mo-binding subunit
MSKPGPERLDVIGVPRRRVDARAKVTGQTRFADDVVLPRMLHCKLLRSPLPHARIARLDTSRALAHPDVQLVLTGADLPIEFGILPVSQDEEALCGEKVRYVGDPVAAVVARDEQSATEALDLIDVEYEPLRTIAGPDEALRHPEPRIHDYGEEGNIHKRVAFRFGDVDEALGDADEVFDDLFFYEGSTHLPLEQHAAVGAVDADGKLTLWSSTQTPHYVHRALAKVLQIPAAHIRVIACPNGGGFGGKSDIFNHEIVVAKAALELGRPVKICLTREEVFYAHRGRHPALMRFRTGVKKDGRLTGMHLQTLIDGGGYGSYGVASLIYTGALQTVTYHLPRYRFEGCRVFTNKPACGPKRGHGTVQPRFGQEVQLDKIARRLEIDPAELRLRIVEQPNTTTANYLRVSTIGLAECIRQVVDASAWNEKFGKLPDGRGVGLACSSYLCGAGLPIYWNKMPQSGVQIQLDRSGGVTVFCGATEIGQGSDDVLVGIVSEVLGVEPFDVRCVTGDTDLTPVDLGSYSSRVTLMAGNAAVQAAERARRLVASAVARKLDLPEERLVFAGRRVFGPRSGLARGGDLRRGAARHAGQHRLLHGARVARAVQGWRRRAVRRLLVQRGGGRGRGRSRHGLDHGPADLDRARHRPGAEPGPGARPGRGQRLHGPGRGADGGAGLQAAAGQALPGSGAQVPVDARVQEPHDARHARGDDDPRRGP